MAERDLSFKNLRDNKRLNKEQIQLDYDQVLKLKTPTIDDLPEAELSQVMLIVIGGLQSRVGSIGEGQGETWCL